MSTLPAGRIKTILTQIEKLEGGLKPCRLRDLVCKARQSMLAAQREAAESAAADKLRLKVKIEALVGQGLSAEEVRRRMKMSRSSLYEAMKRLNIKHPTPHIRKSRITEEQINCAIALRKDGATWATIGGVLNVSLHTIRLQVLKRGKDTKQIERLRHGVSDYRRAARSIGVDAVEAMRILTELAMASPTMSEAIETARSRLTERGRT
ncbi:MAG: hypothetical protein E5V63_25500 [Mesorhizobium sp.]|nr:MAG: hypothetical protein E5V63_25500 [Mesorhizobium sp.]